MRSCFNLEGEGKSDNAVWWYPPLLIVFVFLPLQAGFSAEFSLVVVAAITLSLSDVKRSNSSPSFHMTICCSFSVTIMAVLLGADTVDLSLCSSAVASCFITNLMEAVLCEWL